MSHHIRAPSSHCNVLLSHNALKQSYDESSAHQSYFLWGEPLKPAGHWGSKGPMVPQKTTVAINPAQSLNCVTIT
eukprot:superscaffoldBa00000286_g3502